MSVQITDIQDVIADLEGVAEQRMRAEARLDREMEVLNKLGYESIDDSEKALQALEVKIDKREAALQEEFDDFMDDYGEYIE